MIKRDQGVPMQEALDYFSHEGFTRLFAGARRKYESLGRIGGSVHLARLRDSEREKLGGLLSRNLKKQNSVTVSLQVLDGILKASRFELNLLSLLGLLYGEEIKPKSVQQQEVQSAWKRFVDQLRPMAMRPETHIWLDEVANGDGYGYRIFREVFEDPSLCHKKNLYAVIQAMDHLPVRAGKTEQLPIFAAKRTGDPHFFDRDHLTGRLLYQGILAYLKAPDGGEDGAEHVASLKIREHYRGAGLLHDAISSQVLIMDMNRREGVYTYALTLDTVEHFRDQWEALAAGTGEDAGIEFIRNTLHLKHLFVSENPSVCETIVRRFRKRRPRLLLPGLLCTSGQPSAAALMLLDFFVAHGVIIHYSGDLDVKGLEMARSLFTRYQAYWQPWGMTVPVASEVLAKTEKGVGFSNQELRTLQKMASPWDPALTEILSRSRLKVYQEMFVHQLIEEYENTLL